MKTLRYSSKSEIIEKDAIAIGMKIASESIVNIRTVAGLSNYFCRNQIDGNFDKIIFLCIGRELEVIKNFSKEMNNVEMLIRKKIKFRGLINSFSQSIPILFYGIVLFYGGILVANNEIHYIHLIR